MNGFDFAHAALPEPLEAVRTFRLPRRMRGFAAACVAVALVLIASETIETCRLRSAEGVALRAGQRLEKTRAALGAIAAESTALDVLVAHDRVLRRIRLSGPLAAARLARIGNRLPAGVWLVSMDDASDSYALDGRCADLPHFRRALASLLADRALGEPTLVRVAPQDAGGLGTLAFAIDRGSAR